MPIATTETDIRLQPATFTLRVNEGADRSAEGHPERPVAQGRCRDRQRRADRERRRSLPRGRHGAARVREGLQVAEDRDEGDLSEGRARAGRGRLPAHHDAPPVPTAAPSPTARAPSPAPTPTTSRRPADYDGRLVSFASSPLGRNRWLLAARGRHLVLLDVVSTAASFTLALGLRLEAPSPLFDLYLQAYLWAIPVLIVLRVGAFIWLRLYQRVWRYASVDELVAVVSAVAASSVVGYLVIYAGHAYSAPAGVSFPRSLPVLDSLLVLALAGGWRFAFRIAGIGRVGARTTAGLDRALVVGAGTAAIAVIRDLKRSAEFGLYSVGVLADDLPIGQRLLGLPVLGGSDDLASAIEEHHVSAVLLALPSADGRTLRRLVRQAEAAGARCLTVPSVAEVLAGRISVDALREIDVEDLLRRAPARIDLESVSETFRGRRILITGAGGSIGSELARQLLRFGPQRLILLGRGENSIFEMLQTLGKTEAEIMPVILDIRAADRLRALFRETAPQVVFHAAAHKHVNFMELFPEEAVATNVIGTANMLGAAAENGVERFVHISSDKAVNPSSVMGATKRVSELLVREAARVTSARYANVRFGNVLSSRGSVVPIFRRQLEAGGPLTITDADATRYFMTIPEAVQLVLQAAALADPGDTFVLDMGEPVPIVQLASDLAELHGLELGIDIDVRYTGLRPGEKLAEELLFADEAASPTRHEAIRRVTGGSALPADRETTMAGMRAAASDGRRSEIVAALRHLVPEYHPADRWIEVR